MTRSVLEEVIGSEVTGGRVEVERRFWDAKAKKLIPYKCVVHLKKDLVTRIEGYDGLCVDFSYDPQGRVTAIKSNVTKEFASRTYAYHDNGQVKEEKLTRPGFWETSEYISQGIPTLTMNSKGEEFWYTVSKGKLCVTFKKTGFPDKGRTEEVRPVSELKPWGSDDVLRDQFALYLKRGTHDF